MTKFDQDKNLMEQKERVKTLVNDNLALKRENESLRKQLEACKLEGKVKEEKWMRDTEMKIKKYRDAAELTERVNMFYESEE